MRNKILLFITASILFGVALFQLSGNADIGMSGISTPPVGIGSTSITTLGTVTTGTWNGNKIGIEYGGTNATNATDARTNLGLGSIATQNADNAIVTNLTASGVVDVTGATWTGFSGDTTGNAATANALSAQYIDWSASSGANSIKNKPTLITDLSTTGHMLCNVGGNVTDCAKIQLTGAANAALSGTPLIFTIHDIGTNTDYYFQAYPTQGE